MREIGFALVTAGLVVLLFVVYELVGTNLSEEHSQAQLARDFNAAVAGAHQARTPSTTGPGGSPGHKGSTGKKTPTTKKGEPGTGITTPTPKPSRHGKRGPRSSGAKAGSLPVPPPGGALDHMVIPAIGVDRYVVEGVGEPDLQMGPGHYPGTPLPGQAGNVGIAGHRTTFGAPFFRLNELVPGDYIYLTDISGTTWVYDVVRGWVVPPTDVAVLDASHKPELTLTTCNPRFEATSRLIVRAVLVKGLPRGTRLTGRLPVSAPRRPGTSRPVTSPNTTTSRTTASTLAAATSSTVPGSTVPGTSTTSTAAPGSPGRKGSGGAGADSPTVGPGSGSVSLNGGGRGVWGAALGWAALALLGWVATRLLARRRYGYAKFGVLVCGALVCLVPLWFVFAKVVDLLPANL